MALVDDLAIPITPIMEVCSSFTERHATDRRKHQIITLCKLNKDNERIQLALKGMAS